MRPTHKHKNTGKEKCCKTHKQQHVNRSWNYRKQKAAKWKHVANTEMMLTQKKNSQRKSCQKQNQLQIGKKKKKKRWKCSRGRDNINS